MLFIEESHLEDIPAALSRARAAKVEAAADIEELMEEFDVSGDAQLDIDEFVAMMNTSSEMHFENKSSQSAYL